MVREKAPMQIEEKTDGLTSPVKRHVDTVTATTGQYLAKVEMTEVDRMTYHFFPLKTRMF